jgi:phosphonate utilization associated putative membrane protein
VNAVQQAYLAIGGSVLMHVAWNLLVRQQHGKTQLLWWALATHCLILGPWAIHALVTEAHWTPALQLSLVVSAASNTFYFLVLNRAYAHAPVALVYPIARSSPLLIALWGAMFFGEVLAGPVWAALAVIVAGLVLLAATAWRGGAAAAVPLALAAALATSVYSLSDKLATQHLPSFASLLGFISIGYACSWLALTLQLRRTEGIWRPRAMPRAPYLLIAGLCIGSAYALVIHAMRGLPAAEVVGFTNAGIVVAGVLSMSVFRERAHWPTRLAGIAVICVGLTLLAVGR